MNRSLMALVAAGLACAALAAPAAPLPQFFSSNPRHDRLLNDLMLRHMRVDESPTSLRKGAHGLAPTVGTVHLWRDWEIDECMWYDAGPANFAGEDRHANIALMLRTMPVDSFGYVFTAHDGALPAEIGPLVYFGMGWPFPEYPQAFGSLAAGWEWNGTGTEGWTTSDISQSTVSGGAWTVTAGGKDPCIISPRISCDWIHVPFLCLEPLVEEMDPRITPAERRFRVEWSTEDAPGFSPERSVSSDDWPVVPVADFGKGFDRRLWLPMYLHPGWRGHRITQVRIHLLTPSPTAPADRAARIALKYLRLDYDSRHSINNPIYIRSAARKFYWDNDARQLKALLPNMRRATEFLLTHMQVRKLGLPDQSFFVGHEGLGHTEKDEMRVGHGIGSNYFDILPMGPQDMQSAVMTVQALQSMADVEDYVAAHPALDSPRPTVRGIDGVKPVRYRETAGSLRALASRAADAVRRQLWNPATGRFAGWRDCNGVLKDYGFAHFNVEALAAGIPSPAQARSILDWLNGKRIVAGDTSTGEDLYHWEFAVRMSTRRNRLDYIWPWPAAGVPWGDQVQDGGGVLFTTFFDVKGRLRYGDVEGAWKVWSRMLDHHEKVLQDGGKGADFYREYYRKHPERGKLQGGGPAGGLGLDEEFVESLLTPSAWAVAWLGIETPSDGVLRIAPSIPRALTKMGVRNVVYRGSTLLVQVSRGEIDLRGSAMAPGPGARLRLRFAGATTGRARLYRNGKPVAARPMNTPRGPEWETTLGPDRFTVR